MQYKCTFIYLLTLHGDIVSSCEWLHMWGIVKVYHVLQSIQWTCEWLHMWGIVKVYHVLQCGEICEADVDWTPRWWAEDSVWGVLSTAARYGCWIWSVAFHFSFILSSGSAPSGINPVCLSVCFVLVLNSYNTWTMFMMLSSWQSHCENSPGSFDIYRTAPRDLQTKPTVLGCDSACRL